MRLSLTALALALAAPALAQDGRCPTGTQYTLPCPNRIEQFKPLALPPKPLDVRHIQRYASDALRKLDEGTLDGAGLLLVRIDGDEPDLKKDAFENAAEFIAAVKKRQAHWDGRMVQNARAEMQGPPTITLSAPTPQSIAQTRAVLAIDADLPKDVAFAKAWNPSNRTSGAESLYALRERKRKFFSELADILHDLEF